MAWHIALTLFCLLCIICSIVFRERFTYIFPELIVVAFYVMIFSLVLPFIIRALHSIQDLYFVAVCCFLFLVLIIVMINVIKRMRHSRQIRADQNINAGIIKNRISSKTGSEQPALQKIRLKQIITDQRIVQQRETFTSNKINTAVEHDIKPKTTVLQNDMIPHHEKELGLTKAPGELINEINNSKNTPIHKDIPKPAEQGVLAEPPETVQPQPITVVLQPQTQREERSNIAILDVPAPEQEMPDIKALDRNHKETYTKIESHAKAPALAASDLPAGPQEADVPAALPEEKHKPIQYKKGQKLAASIHTEEPDEKNSEQNIAINEPSLQLEKPWQSREEKQYTAALIQMNRGNYAKAVQILKKIEFCQAQPLQQKQMELTLVKALAASSEYLEATNQVYSFLSNGYDLNEEENKEVMDILYLLQKNA